MPGEAAESDDEEQCGEINTYATVAVLDDSSCLEHKIHVENNADSLGSRGNYGCLFEGVYLDFVISLILLSLIYRFLSCCCALAQISTCTY